MRQVRDNETSIKEAAADAFKSQVTAPANQAAAAAAADYHHPHMSVDESTGFMTCPDPSTSARLSRGSMLAMQYQETHPPPTSGFAPTRSFRLA